MHILCVYVVCVRMLIMVDQLKMGHYFGGKICQQVNSLFSVGSSVEVRAAKVAIAWSLHFKM